MIFLIPPASSFILNKCLSVSVGRLQTVWSADAPGEVRHALESWVSGKLGFQDNVAEEGTLRMGSEALFLFWAETFLNRGGKEGSARAVPIVCLCCKSPAFTKSCIVPVCLLGRAASLPGTGVGERLIGALWQPKKGFLSFQRKAPVKISGPGGLGWNPTPMTYDFTFLLITHFYFLFCKS